MLNISFGNFPIEMAMAMAAPVHNAHRTLHSDPPSLQLEEQTIYMHNNGSVSSCMHQVASSWKTVIKSRKYCEFEYNSNEDITIWIIIIRENRREKKKTIPEHTRKNRLIALHCAKTFNWMIQLLPRFRKR